MRASETDIPREPPSNASPRHCAPSGRSAPVTSNTGPVLTMGQRGSDLRKEYLPTGQVLPPYAPGGPEYRLPSTYGQAFATHP